MIILTSLLTITFLVLAVIHLNWAIGNTWGLKNALPTTEDGKLLFKPGPFASFAVGIGLTIFGLFYQITPQEGNSLNWIFEVLGWGIPVIFLLRAIGNFKYVGFFKKVKDTDFAKMDSKFFSPLCLGIGLLGLVVQVFG